MATYTEILDADIAPGQPAFSSVMERMRDNPIAIAQGDASVPTSSKIVAAAFKQPTTAAYSVVLGRQVGSQAVVDSDGVQTLFQCVVVVAGAYRMSGTRSSTNNNTVEFFKNDVSLGTTSDAAFNYDVTLAAGDKFAVKVETTISLATITHTDYRFTSEIVVPMAQCQFFRF